MESNVHGTSSSPYISRVDEQTDQKADTTRSDVENKLTNSDPSQKTFTNEELDTIIERETKFQQEGNLLSELDKIAGPLPRQKPEESLHELVSNLKVDSEHTQLSPEQRSEISAAAREAMPHFDALILANEEYGGDIQKARYAQELKEVIEKSNEPRPAPLPTPAATPNRVVVPSNSNLAKFLEPRDADFIDKQGKLRTILEQERAKIDDTAYEKLIKALDGNGSLYTTCLLLREGESISVKNSKLPLDPNNLEAKTGLNREQKKQGIVATLTLILEYTKSGVDTRQTLERFKNRVSLATYNLPGTETKALLSQIKAEQEKVK